MNEPAQSMVEPTLPRRQSPMHDESRFKSDTDESVRGSEQSHININRFTLPKDARDLIIATIMAAAILTIVILGFLLHDAYKDIQTQVWLRDDALTKFTTGPYADLRAEVKANQIIIATLGAQCVKPK